MEPRTHARGNSQTKLTSGSRPLCFNGATHSRAWKPEWYRLSFADSGWLQWSHALTRVETPMLRRLPAHRPQCFNGATHSRAWKPSTVPCVSAGGCMLQWSHALTRVETGALDASDTGTGSFNGATHSRAWKPLCDQETSSRVTVLQWSHALTRVETPKPNEAHEQR